MGWLGDAWDAVKDAASNAWDWLSGNGPASWISRLLAIFLGLALLVIGLLLWFTMSFWV